MPSPPFASFTLDARLKTALAFGHIWQFPEMGRPTGPNSRRLRQQKYFQFLETPWRSTRSAGSSCGVRLISIILLYIIIFQSITEPPFIRTRLSPTCSVKCWHIPSPKVACECSAYLEVHDWPCGCESKTRGL